MDIYRNIINKWLYWLMVWNMNFIFPYVGNSNPNWLSYFSEGLKPPTSIYIYGYGSIPINTIFRGMNIHVPAILMFTRGTRFWHTAIYIWRISQRNHVWLLKLVQSSSGLMVASLDSISKQPKKPPFYDNKNESYIPKTKGDTWVWCSVFFSAFFSRIHVLSLIIIVDT